MRNAGIEFLREFNMHILYKGNHVGTRRADFFVEQKISVEIKACKALDGADLAQGKNYLEAYNLEIGLLINFGAKSLEFKRLINSKFKLN